MPHIPMPPGSDAAAYKKNTTEQYESLGRFVEAFERIVHEVRESSVALIERDGNPVGRAITKAHRKDMRAKSLASKPMTVEQVEAFADRVGAIGDDLGNLTDDMLKRGGAR